MNRQGGKAVAHFAIIDGLHIFRCFIVDTASGQLHRYVCTPIDKAVIDRRTYSQRALNAASVV